MLRKLSLSVLTLFTAAALPAQNFSIKGKVTNSQLEPLPFVTVQLKETKIGTITSEKGLYELTLDEGQYSLVVTMLGYKSQVIPLVLNRNLVVNIILEPAAATDLGEVVVTGKVRDRAEEYVRQVIRHKDSLLAASGPFSASVYIKATQEDSGHIKRKKKKRAIIDSASMAALLANRDLQRMSMAEISLRYDQLRPGTLKEERLGVVKRGSPESLFFLSVSEADFNLYNNLLRARTVSVTPFVSPVSYAGLSAYRFKTSQTKIVGGRKHYTIIIKPRQLSNATVEGEMIIEDSSWVIRSAKFRLPSYHLPEYDYFEVEQHYEFVDDKAWMIQRQSFNYGAKHGKAKLTGRTIASYHTFELQKRFTPGHFGNEISTTAEEAYERDSLFWERSRPEPLTAKEMRFIRYRDSIHRVTHSQEYLDSIDRQTNRVTWKKLMFSGQTLYHREKERTWYIAPAVSLFQPFSFGGTRLMTSAHYAKVYKSRKTISVGTNLSYGIRNNDVNGSVRLFRMYNPFNRGYYKVEARRDFQYIFSGDAWINMIKRNNFYLDNSIGAGHGMELANGLFLESGLEMAFRRSVSNYKTNDQVDSLFGDILEDNKAIAFTPYNALYGRARLSFTPAQRYIREPREKIILGSKWPTFYVEIRKGVSGLFNSKIDFDYLETGLHQEIKLGVAGISRYHVLSGDFLSRRDLRLVDYKYQRRGDPILFMNPTEAFQSLDSTFPVFNRFYQGHWVHEFNGAIVNKIPLFKKLKLREIAGAGFLVAPERKLRYAEAFTGIERVFRAPFNPLIRFKLGVYVIGSAANQFRNPVQFKIGITSWDRLRNRWF